MHGPVGRLSSPRLINPLFQWSEAELHTSRTALPRGLRRAQLANRGVRLFTPILAVLAVFPAHDTSRQAGRMAEASWPAGSSLAP